jgi:hypothetical protein
LRGSRRLGCARAVTRGVNHADNGLNGHGFAFADLDFFEHAGGRRGNFGVDLVRRDLEQRFVALDFVAGFLEPLGDGTFKDAFAHLGHYDVDCHLRSPVVRYLLETGTIVPCPYNFDRSAMHSQEWLCY